MNFRASPEYHQDPVRSVEKLADGTIKFPYTKQNSMGTYMEYDFRVTNKNGKVIIANYTKETESNRGHVFNKDTTYELDVSSEENFLNSLGKALDSYVSKPRPSASEKGEQIYKLLWYNKETLIIQDIKKEQQSLAEEIEKDLSSYRWNEKNKTLSYSYDFNAGMGNANDRFAVVTIKIVDGGFLITTDTKNTRRSWSAKSEKIYMENTLSNFPSDIRNMFNKGIKLSRGNMRVEDTTTLQKIKEKADGAVKAIKYYKNRSK